MSFKAEIIADSIVSTGERLTTFVVTFPRIVLAEFNTHRMFSRNSASSRAIPFKKMLKMVKENPFIPLAWQKDHSGMQGNDYLDVNALYSFKDVSTHLLENFKYKDMSEADVEILEIINNVASNADFKGEHSLIEWWFILRDKVCECATLLFCLNVTKQICNRLLETFMWHTVIVTSSEWENFFGLRADPPAEIHVQKLAYMMLDEYNKHEPKFLKPGEWHIPFGDKIDLTKLAKEVAFEHLGEKALEKAKIKIACARCARVSYTVVGEEGKPDNYEADLKLHDRLAESGHWSAMEHCARAMNQDEYEHNAILTNLTGKIAPTESFGWSGNFKGFIQYRKTFENENRKDSRVIKNKKHETN